jgi:hypothetical protein
MHIDAEFDMLTGTYMVNIGDSVLNLTRDEVVTLYGRCSYALQDSDTKAESNIKEVDTLEDQE